MNKNKLVPEIKNDHTNIKQITINNIKKDKLKFKYEYESFTAYDNLQLLEYILGKDDDWVLNASDLDELFKYFNGRFERQYLRKKCFKYGIDYKFPQ